MMLLIVALYFLLMRDNGLIFCLSVPYQIRQIFLKGLSITKTALPPKPPIIIKSLGYINL